MLSFIVNFVLFSFVELHLLSWQAENAGGSHEQVGPLTCGSILVE